MSAPQGFDPTASLLPANPSAHIVPFQGGGGSLQPLYQKVLATLSEDKRKGLPTEIQILNFTISVKNGKFVLTLRVKGKQDTVKEEEEEEKEGEEEEEAAGEEAAVEEAAGEEGIEVEEEEGEAEILRKAREFLRSQRPNEWNPFNDSADEWGEFQTGEFQTATNPSTPPINPTNNVTGNIQGVLVNISRAELAASKKALENAEAALAASKKVTENAVAAAARKKAANNAAAAEAAARKKAANNAVAAEAAARKKAEEALAASQKAAENAAAALAAAEKQKANEAAAAAEKQKANAAFGSAGLRREVTESKSRSSSPENIRRNANEMLAGVTLTDEELARDSSTIRRRANEVLASQSNNATPLNQKSRLQLQKSSNNGKVAFGVLKASQKPQRRPLSY
jgi:hypothetical protein